MKSIITINIEPTDMVEEGSWGERPLGSHASTMELFMEEHSHASGMIEWDIPDLERTEHIGLQFERMTDGQWALCDYDGVFSLPQEAIALLRSQGYLVGEEFDPSVKEPS